MFLSRRNVILVATDFGDAAHLALDAAIELADMAGSSLEILHVRIDLPVVVTPPDSVVPFPIDLSGVDATDDALMRVAVARVQRRGIRCTSHSGTGRPETVIVDRATTIGADLIVMGTAKHSGIARLFVGSVAELVLRHAPCPVLVVPVITPAVEKPVADPVPGADLADALPLPA